MSDRKREILARVASGELAPEEALALLGQPGPGGERATGAAPNLPVIVKADLGAVTIIGDPTVQDAVAVGAHVLRRTPDAIRIEGAHDGSVLSDGRLLPRRGRRHALRVRLRPDLALQVRIDAGTVHVEGMESTVDIEVDLGTAALEGVSGPFDIRVGSGSVSVMTLLTTGRSAITCDLGSVTVRLDPASSVAVTAATDAGRLVLPGQRSRPVISFGTTGEAMVGKGEASLDIKTGAGSVNVGVGQ